MIRAQQTVVSAVDAGCSGVAAAEGGTIGDNRERGRCERPNNQ
jgi:hypothetical protein